MSTFWSCQSKTTVTSKEKWWNSERRRVTFSGKIFSGFGISERIKSIFREWATSPARWACQINVTPGLKGLGAGWPAGRLAGWLADCSDIKRDESISFGEGYAAAAVQTLSHLWRQFTYARRTRGRGFPFKVVHGYSSGFVWLKFRLGLFELNFLIEPGKIVVNQGHSVMAGRQFMPPSFQQHCVKWEKDRRGAVFL